MPILIERWQSLGHRAAVVGPKGSGKTTLLEELALYLDSVGMSVTVLRITAEKDLRSFFASLRQMKAEVLLLDGAEQLSWPAWLLMKAILGPSRGLIATMHKEGRLPVLYETFTSPELLKELLFRLGQEGLLSEEEVQKYCEVAGGNIREVFFCLYARCAGIGNDMMTSPTSRTIAFK